MWDSVAMLIQISIFGTRRERREAQPLISSCSVALLLSALLSLFGVNSAQAQDRSRPQEPLAPTHMAQCSALAAQYAERRNALSSASHRCEIETSRLHPNTPGRVHLRICRGSGHFADAYRTCAPQREAACELWWEERAASDRCRAAVERHTRARAAQEREEQAQQARQRIAETRIRQATALHADRIGRPDRQPVQSGQARGPVERAETGGAGPFSSLAPLVARGALTPEERLRATMPILPTTPIGRLVGGGQMSMTAVALLGAQNYAAQLRAVASLGEGVGAVSLRPLPQLFFSLSQSVLIDTTIGAMRGMDDAFARFGPEVAPASFGVTSRFTGLATRIDEQFAVTAARDWGGLGMMPSADPLGQALNGAMAAAMAYVAGVEARRREAGVEMVRAEAARRAGEERARLAAVEQARRAEQERQRQAAAEQARRGAQARQADDRPRVPQTSPGGWSPTCRTMLNHGFADFAELCRQMPPSAQAQMIDELVRNGLIRR